MSINNLVMKLAVLTLAGLAVVASPALCAENKLKASDEPVMISIPGKNYELGKTEVTQKQWKAIMGSNPSRFQKCSNTSTCGDENPVENVSWDDVHVFIAKLNVQTGKKYRLPTDAEWEYACHAGSGGEYCGDSLVKVAWYEANSGGKTHPVATKRPNAWGLHDMTGNVWEWIENCHDSACKYRVLRGGSWGNYTGNMRAANRYSVTPGKRSSGNGFRVARTLPQ